MLWPTWLALDAFVGLSEMALAGDALDNMAGFGRVVELRFWSDGDAGNQRLRHRRWGPSWPRTTIVCWRESGIEQFVAPGKVYSLINMFYYINTHIPRSSISS